MSVKVSVGLGNRGEVGDELDFGCGGEEKQGGDGATHCRAVHEGYDTVVEGLEKFSHNKNEIWVVDKSGG